MNQIFSSLLSLAKNKKAKQVGSLYTSMILGIILGICVSIINTRLLGPQQFGDLKFLHNLFGFVVSFLTFGTFASGCRLLALRENEPVKHLLIGNLLILASAISLILIIGLFIFSFFEESIFNNQLGRIIRIFSPLLFVFPFEICIESIMTGDNRIYELSILRAAPKFLYIVGAISFNYFVPLSLTSALTIQLLILSILIFIMVILLKPKFEELKKYITIIIRENRTYGFHVYLGRLAGVSSAYLAGIFIGYFIDNTNVGFFSLAITVTTPLAMIPNAVGTSFYKDFANMKVIPIKATLTTIFLSFSALISFIVVIKKVILLLYSQDFKPVIPMAYYLSVASVIYGFGDYFTRFLGAHGRGKEMRNSAIVVGVSNVLGFYILVKYFGVMGAVFTRIISSLVYLSLRYYPYRKLINRYQSHDNLQE